MKNLKIFTKGLLVLTFLFVVSVLLTIYVFSQEASKTNPEEEVKANTTRTCQSYYEEISEEFSKLVTPREWYVLSTYASEESIDVSINLPQEDLIISYFLNGKIGTVPFVDNKWRLSIPTASLLPGEYTLEFVANNCDDTFHKVTTFKISQPIYVTWTIDWEGFDVKEEYLTTLASISSQYNIPMTHFFNPYIYIYLPKERAIYLTNWVKSRDESIGLHLHMYDSLVETAGVEVNDSITWGSTSTIKGHDTPNTSYQNTDYEKIINWSINQFEENGLPRPKMFRAGAWFVNEDNIRVLNNLGFEIEASGRTTYIHGRNKLQGEWNLKETTQPYQLNSLDKNIINSGDLNIWQYPNNGGDSWAYTSEQLINRFKLNYSGEISKEKKVVTYLSHPHWLDKEGPNISETFKYIERYSYEKDNGPVIFLELDKVHIEK